MVNVIEDFIRTLTEPVEKFAKDMVPVAKPKTPGGIADVPDTTSKNAIEKNSEKNIIPAWLNTWIWGEQFPDNVLADSFTPLPLQPILPTPSSAAKKYADLLRDTNIRTWIALEELTEGSSHKLLLEIFKSQISHREETVINHRNRMNRYSDQLRAFDLSRRMLEEQVTSTQKTQAQLETAHNICMAVAAGAFILTAIAFVGASGGASLGWFAANKALIDTTLIVTSSASSAGAGVTQLGKAQLQEKSGKYEARIIAIQHESDRIDLEMKAMRQWWSHVFSSITQLYGSMRKIEQKRHESSKMGDQ